MADMLQVHLEELELFLPDIEVLFNKCDRYFRSDEELLVEQLLVDLEEAQNISSCFICIFNFVINTSEIYEDIVTNLNLMLNKLNDHRIHFQNKHDWHQIRAQSSVQQKVTIIHSGQAGRPKISIEEEQVAGLRSLGMNWKKIATLLGVSEDTLRRRRREFQENLDFAELDDTQLDELVKQILDEHPCLGERMLQGHLLSRGFIVQRARLRTSIKRVTPNKQTFNKRKIFRRTYNVACPNALW